MDTPEGIGGLISFLDHVQGFDENDLRKLTEFYRKGIQCVFLRDPLFLIQKLYQATAIDVDLAENVKEIVERSGAGEAADRLFDELLRTGGDSMRSLWKVLYCEQKVLMESPRGVPNEEDSLRWWRGDLKGLLHHMVSEGPSILKEMWLSEEGPELCPEMEELRKVHRAAVLSEEAVTGEPPTPCSQAECQAAPLPPGPPAQHFVGLTMVVGHRSREQTENELAATAQRHAMLMDRDAGRQRVQVEAGTLFRRVYGPGRECGPPRVALVSGGAGMGKSVLLQHLMRQWALGEAFRNFAFVLLFQFRHLNGQGELSLHQLIARWYPHLAGSLAALLSSPETLLMMFDGLDESRIFPELHDDIRSISPDQKMAAVQLAWEVMAQNLVPGCSVLMTSRPEALKTLGKGPPSCRYLELLGFLAPERRMYFRRFFDDDHSARVAFRLLEENEHVYAFSFNPAFCRIACTVLRDSLRKSGGAHQSFGKTLSQLYARYILDILSRHCAPSQGTAEELAKIGQLAFQGLCNRALLFTQEEVLAHGLEPTRFLTGFLSEILEREVRADGETLYSFAHLTLQEFLGALSFFLGRTGEPRLGQALERLEADSSGRFQMLARFLSGITSPLCHHALHRTLASPFPSEVSARVKRWLRERALTRRSEKISFLNTLHCLFECQDRALAREALAPLRRLDLAGLALSDHDCQVLAYVVGCCLSMEGLVLSNTALNGERMEKLGPALHKVRIVWLSDNNLGERGTQVLTEALRDRDWQLQELVLMATGLTDDRCQDLLHALGPQDMLTHLSLGRNQLTDRSIPALRGVTERCRKLGTIWLNNNKFSANGSRHLRSLSALRPGLNIFT
ncbi:NACHT, LRR and PYD domains-containing protein 12-like [Mustelus asterias]